MSDANDVQPRPVSLIAILAIFALFAAFLLLIDLTYLHHRAPPPYNVAPEKLTADQAWQATPESRLAYLAELRAKHNHQLESYGWTDQKAGVVQIPIERAMELVVRDANTSSK